ncbi:short-subunit dehydrogenase [Asanoa ferruginea]|uniref:Short-subunit dehydrogenase n=1 Tax=Asanoa ferruginea TaxID=53367 RepID=A0A3D9ZQW2_9ACTN|nr:SDR family NAD(P)-dependent oxidoreductase [Asanoa ferruginea]REF99615.1 short-subunit dehydrogenase [Asanoa ferruginea]GIF53780.1 short-chain dehydrogenase [Asanoa ferruginea]
MGTRTQHSRVVVVTGASSGIGRATALAFADRGDHLVLAARSDSALQTVAAECAARGARVIVEAVDVNDARAVRDLGGLAVGAFGRIDVWVHTAAVMAYGRFEDVPADVFDRVVRTDLLGSAAVARVALARFRAQDSGVLVLGGSLLGSITAPYMSAYITSKWGLRGLARVLRQETRDAPAIEVCLVDPGGVNTPIYRTAANYAGRVGRPPPPVDRPEKVAAAILKVADHPRRSVSVGWANPLIRVGFSTMPAVYDALVGPLMRRGGLSREPVAAHTGNVFAPLPGQAATTASWGRQWLRPVAASAAAVALVAGAAAGRRLHAPRRRGGAVSRAS